MPIGNGGDAPKQYDVVVIDLDKEMEFLEGAGIRKDEITAMCEYCGETVAQDQNMCASCHIPVAWMHSTVWKKNYGDPTTFLRGLKEPELSPKTALEVRAVEAFGTKGKFSNVTQAKDFRSLVGNYPEGYIMRLIEWARGTHVGFHNFVTAVKNGDNVRRWEADNASQEAVHDDEESDPDDGWGDWMA